VASDAREAADGRGPATVRFYEPIERGAEAVEDLDAARLVVRFQAGEVEVFTDLYRLYFDRVYGYLKVALKDRHEAEDAIQQVFAQVFVKLAGYQRRKQPFRAWLFVVVRNLAISELRKSGRLELTDPAELRSHRDRNGGEGDEYASLGPLSWVSDRDLTMFVERLPLAQRQVLMLRYMLDLSNGEVAEVLGRSSDEVKVLHHRAVKFLRQRLSAIGRSPHEGRRVPALRRFKQAEVLRHRRWALLR
jgi:RNA polymerase sigma-70 factor (ECF subfamily)